MLGDCLLWVDPRAPVSHLLNLYYCANLCYYEEHYRASLLIMHVNERRQFLNPTAIILVYQLLRYFIHGCHYIYNLSGSITHFCFFTFDWRFHRFVERFFMCDALVHHWKASSNNLYILRTSSYVCFNQCHVSFMVTEERVKLQIEIRKQGF